MFEKAGVKIVNKGSRKHSNEIEILKDEKKFYLRLAENAFGGLFDSYIDGMIDFDAFEVCFCILRNGHSALVKDEVTWLAQTFNLQIDDLAWNVASHYNTGLYIMYSSLNLHFINCYIYTL